MDSASLYLLTKSAHVIAIIAWMAGLLYLPRLFVYHVDAERGSKQSETFKVMERRLLRAITNPAMIASWVLGLVLVFFFESVDIWSEGWFHVKLTLVIGLTIYHMALARWRRAFERDANTHSSAFFRVMNEVPTILMIGIVVMAVMRPF